MLIAFGFVLGFQWLVGTGALYIGLLCSFTVPYQGLESSPEVLVANRPHVAGHNI